LSLHRRSRRFSHDSIEDRPNLIDDKPDPIHKLIIDDMMSKVLTPKQSRALKLTVLEGLTLKETASLLGFKSPTSVWHLVQIAKRKLRKALAGESVPCLPNQIIKQED
jgi:DNA-directed RNA polymerase specialized sigma24 family protein